jgi:glutathione synthase/RimK-type ligase-like ATP-grasp enzyme
VQGNYNKFINWGCSSIPDLPHNISVLNPPEAVAKCVDKQVFFEEVGDVTGMTAAYNRAAAEALFSRYRKVVCRTRVNGSGGDGIVVARSAAELVDAKLYTAYIPKRAEYRVHVFNGNVILMQQKRRSSNVTADADDDSNLIRNHANGWIYAVDAVDTPPPELGAKCIEVVRELGLHFGAVDVMLGLNNNRPYILEVNTAPGVQSPTLLEAYKQAILSFWGS